MILCLVSQVEAADWSQWRGGDRTGDIAPGSEWPSGIDPSGLRERWRVKLGPSYSGPLVVGNRIFVTETRDKKTEVVTAFDRNDGKVIWTQAWEGALSVPFFAKSNGDWIRATPAYADGRLYVAGMRDVLVCLNAEDGSVLWKLDFVQQLKTPLPDFGFVCSPLVDGDAVYVQAGAGVAKVNRVDGKVIWRSMEDGGGMMGSAFSSPVIAEIQGVRQLVVQTRTQLAGIDLESGSVLWKQEIEAFRGMNILTPTVIGNRIFTSSYGGKSVMVEIQKQGSAWSVQELWNNKAQGYMSSPLVIDDHIYLHLKNQRATCIDVQTGEATWTTTPFGRYWSMVRNGNKILALDERGELHLIAADPKEFRLLGTRRVSDEESWAHVAVADQQIIVRPLQSLVVFDWDVSLAK